MVDITLSVFKDAAEAIDKLVDVLGKIDGMVKNAALEGREVMEWRSARRLEKILTKILVDTNEMRIRNMLILSHFESYALNPSQERWKMVQSEVEGMVTKVTDVLAILQTNHNLVTLDFFDPLSQILNIRKTALTYLEEIKRPESESELKELKLFSDKYDLLKDELSHLRWVIRYYIRERWPAKSFGKVK